MHKQYEPPGKVQSGKDSKTLRKLPRFSSDTRDWRTIFSTKKERGLQNVKIENNDIRHMFSIYFSQFIVTGRHFNPEKV